MAHVAWNTDNRLPREDIEHQRGWRRNAPDAHRRYNHFSGSFSDKKVLKQTGAYNADP